MTFFFFDTDSAVQKGFQLFVMSSCTEYGRITLKTDVHIEKRKTGYQLYHKYRVKQVKCERQLKHHAAFKQAAFDWSKLSETEKQSWNSQANSVSHKMTLQTVKHEDFQHLLSWPCHQCLIEESAAVPGGACFFCSFFFQ